MAHLAICQNAVIQVFDDLMNTYGNFSSRTYLKRYRHYVRVDLLPLAEPIRTYFIMAMYIATFPPIRPGHVSVYMC